MQRPWGRSVDGILQEQQGVKCGWSQVAKHEVESDCGYGRKAKDYADF